MEFSDFEPLVAASSPVDTAAAPLGDRATDSSAPLGGGAECLGDPDATAHAHADAVGDEDDAAGAKEKVEEDYHDDEDPAVAVAAAAERAVAALPALEGAKVLHFTLQANLLPPALQRPTTPARAQVGENVQWWTPAEEVAELGLEFQVGHGRW